MKASADGAGRWWDPGLLASWIGVNAAAYVVVVVSGVALEMLASNTTSGLASDQRVVAVVLVAVIGAGFHRLVLGLLDVGSHAARGGDRTTIEITTIEQRGAARASMHHRAGPRHRLREVHPVRRTPRSVVR